MSGPSIKLLSTGMNLDVISDESRINCFNKNRFHGLLKSNRCPYAFNVGKVKEEVKEEEKNLI